MHEEKSQGTKNDQGKPPLELLDRVALEETAKVMAHGERKYKAYNWRHGLSQRRTLGAALRHIYAHLDGETNDEETNLLHLAHAICELMFAIRMLRERPDLDDRYKGPMTRPIREAYMDVYKTVKPDWKQALANLEREEFMMDLWRSE